MRIAVVNWNDQKVGGAESYLAQILPALVKRGEELAFWCEVSTPADRASVVPREVPKWCAAEMGRSEALAALRAWGPDLLYVQGLTNAEVEAELQRIAPGIFYLHGYYGTCISGSKTLHRPEVIPCNRRFGWACIGHFYPNRCGGLNPLTMWADFQLQSRRLEMLRQYRAVLCASTHMRQELLNHGLEPRRVRLAPYPIPQPEAAPKPQAGNEADLPDRPWRVLCAGRLERQKGGDLLLDALPLIRSRLGRPLEVLFAGEGRERAALEREAAVLMQRDPGLRVEFTGWLDKAALDALMATADLMALPSVWPEPFGMIGLEAGHLSVPTVAFAVGGIPDWLEHGVNGMLAPAAPPTAEGLAAAVIGCLDPVAYPRLAAGARAAAHRFSLDAHLRLLVDAIEQVTEPAVVS